MHELVEKPRLADAGLAHDADNLTLAGRGPIAGATQQLELGFATDESGEPPGREGLHPRSWHVDAGQLVHVDGRLEPLDGHLAEGLACT